MRYKTVIYLLIVIGVVEANKKDPFSQERRLLQTIWDGKLTKRYLDRYHFTRDQLNKLIDGQTPLTVAIENKMDLAVHLLVDAGVHIDKQPDGSIPIELAVQYGTVPTVRYLLEHGVIMTKQACRLASKRTDMFRFFADTIGKIKLSDKKGIKNNLNISRAQVDTCLENMLLTVENPVDLQDLLKRGAHTDYRDEQQEIALDYAVKSCRDKNTKILISQGSPAAQKENIKVAREKCENDKSPLVKDCCKTFDVVINTKTDDDIYPNFVKLVKNNSLSEDFLKHHFAGINKLDINRTFSELNNEDALSLAVRQCYYDATSLLLKYGANTLDYVFPIALKKCPKEMVRLLLDNGAKLHRVVRPLELIIQYNPDAENIIAWLAPIVSGHQRQQALLLACLKGKKGIAAILLDNQVDINFEGEHGQTPLWNALLSHDEAMVKFILERGVRTTITPEQRRYMQKFFPAGYQLVAVPGQYLHE